MRIFNNEPIIAVKTYVCPETALVNYMFYQRFVYHRCNIAIDAVMGAGVYGYTDIVSSLSGLNRKGPDTKKYVIGVIEGYLHGAGTTRTKICLDSRSCKLLVFSHNLLRQLERHLYSGKKINCLLD